MSEEEIKEEYDFIVGFTLFGKSGFKTMYRHFNKLETAKLFASNVNLKENSKIYVDLDLYNKEKEKNEELENADLTTVYMNGFYDGEKKWKDKIKKNNLQDKFLIESKGTSYEEEGNDTYPNVKRLLDDKGISYSKRSATVLVESDYQKYDYFIGMDDANIRNMRKILFLM